MGASMRNLRMRKGFGDTWEVIYLDEDKPRRTSTGTKSKREAERLFPPDRTAVIPENALA